MPVLSKSFFLSLFCLAALTASAAAQSAPKNEGRDADRRAIRAHVDSIFQAYINKDREKVRATHSEDWHGYSTGTRTLRRGLDEYMKMADGSLSNKEGGMTGYKFTEFEIVFHGDMALVFYVADVEGKAGSLSFTDKYRSIDVYAKRNGDWIQVASNLNRHPDEVARRMSAPTPVSPQLRKIILEAREKVWRAWFSNDRAALEKMIPEDALAINNDSEAWADRAHILAGAKSFADSGARLVRLEFPRTEIQIYGNTIILYTTYLYEVEAQGKRSATSGRGTEIFVQRNNELVNTGWHLDSGK